MRNLILICLLGLVQYGCKDREIERVKLTELNGDQIDLSAYEGKTVFINFWATWCKPCIQEMPTIESAEKALKAENVVFLIASNEEPDDIERFARKRPFSFHYVRVQNLEELKIPALPTTYIFNKDGKLKFSETGSRDWSTQDNLNLITNSK